MTISQNPTTYKKICVKCDLNCATCQATDKTICLTCLPGYYLEKGKCKVYRDGCIKVEGTAGTSGKCEICGYGFRKNEAGYCMNVISPEGGYYYSPTPATATNCKTDVIAAEANVVRSTSPPTNSTKRYLR